jgi:4-amino-4-deoxy-L-arabinose transferase-like glycosyltransferase
MFDGPEAGESAARHGRGAAAWAALVLLVGLALRCYAITGELSPDSTVYAQNAHNFLHGTFTLRDDSWYAHRLPVFVPVAAAYAAWGVNAVSTHLWPLLLSLAQLGLTMWLGARLLGGRAGIVAGGLLAFLPLDVLQAGSLMPDGVMATLLAAAAAFWILGQGASRDRSRLLMLLSGACLALATVVRVYSIVLAALYVGTAISRPRRLRDLAWPLLGGLAVGLPLAGVYLWATGDALYPLRVVSSAYGSQLAPEGNRWLFYPSLLLRPGTETAFYPALFAAAIVFSLARLDRARFLLLLWALPLLLFLEFGTMSFTAYIPIYKRSRFLTVTAAPLSLLTASMLCAVAPWLRERWRRARPRVWGALMVTTGGVVLLAALANSLYVLRREHAQRAAAKARTEAVTALLSSQPTLPIFIDHWRTACRLAYYFGFREGSGFYRGADDRARMARAAAPINSRFRYLSWYPAANRLPSGFVVLDDTVLAAVAGADSTSRGPFFAGEVPGYCYRPPASWHRLQRIGTWTVFENRPR